VRRLWVVPALALVGCGRFGFGSDTADGAPHDGPSGDGARVMFSTPIAITEVDDPSQQDDDPTLTADLLELYFDSSREPGVGFGNGDVWVATRMSVDDPFSTPVLVTELASDADDTTPDLSADGLRMYLGSDRASPGNRDLFVSERASRTSPWSTPVLIPELTSLADDSGAIEIDDGLGLIFCSARAGNQDLYLTTRTAIGQPWSPPVAIPGLSDPSYDESQHWANADGTVVYFSSVGAPGAEASDIFVATRPDASSPFGPPERVPELDTTVDDLDPWLSPDERTVVFMSYRTGLGDLYIATR
jgi:hypothetical protein